MTTFDRQAIYKQLLDLGVDENGAKAMTTALAINVHNHGPTGLNFKVVPDKELIAVIECEITRESRFGPDHAGNDFKIRCLPASHPMTPVMAKVASELTADDED
jgi:hypothetical protein